MTTSNFRPSNLPKLAECLHYESLQKPSEEAERGTLLDQAFRKLVAGENIESFSLTEEEKNGVEWAANVVINYCNDHPVYSDEEHCQKSTNNPPISGTMDALCVPLSTTFDLKTGTHRNYDEQMAAYAYMCMAEHFKEEWKTVILFSDLQVKVERLWTFDEAQHVVNELFEAWTNRQNTSPQVSQYCGWCAKGINGDQSCSAVRAVMKPVAEIVDIVIDKNTVLNDPKAAGIFLKGMALLEKIKEEVNKQAKEGRLLPEGYKLQTRTGRKEVNPLFLRKATEEKGIDWLFNLSPKVSIEAISKEYPEGLPENATLEGKPYQVLMPVPSKAPKLTQ